MNKRKAYAKLRELTKANIKDKWPDIESHSKQYTLHLSHCPYTDQDYYCDDDSFQRKPYQELQFIGTADDEQLDYIEEYSKGFPRADQWLASSIDCYPGFMIEVI